MDREHRREAMLAAAARREAAQAAHVPADKVAEAVSKLVRMGFSEGESKTAVDTYHTFEGALKQLMPTRKSKPLAPASTSARHGRPSPFGGGIGYDFGSDDDEEEQEQELELAQADRKEKRRKYNINIYIYSMFALSTSVIAIGRLTWRGAHLPQVWAPILRCLPYRPRVYTPF